ncbi:MAG: SynChlorMet cassette protein ScmD [Syntrophales bacterium]|jgi:SynChlorMet cassette protein ScmD|nr:SynChlorMet cassette protein ScmD [Syntrophales bacterium]
MEPASEILIMANPLVVLREEFDDWAILFDPDTGSAFGINPIGVMVWKLLDGCHSLEKITDIIREAAEEVPEDVAEHIRDFVRATVEFGLAGPKAA